MKIRNTLPALLLCLLLCTGCANVPEPDPEHESLSLLTDVLVETVPEIGTETAAATTQTSAATQATETTESGETTEASAFTEAIPDDSGETSAADTTEARQPWQNAYQRTLKQRYLRSEHEASYFALIQLNDDDIPELVILDGIEMALYCSDGNKAVLLLEDAYKGNAIDEQNVCYQPKNNLFSTAFSTMGGGSGFTIFSYQTLDPFHAERFYFDNNENVDGEMPYNAIWDRAEEFEITDNGYHDVTLGDSWVHIGEGFSDLWELTEANAESVVYQWSPPSDGEKDEEESEE